MIVYIAGPMTNIPHFNRPAFIAAAKRLSRRGDIPLNPAILPDGLSQAVYGYLHGNASACRSNFSA